MNCARKLFLFVLICSSLSGAENAFLGTWKENTNKSIYSNYPSVQSALIRIDSSGENRVKIAQEIVNRGGEKHRTVEESPLDGTEVHPSGGSGSNPTFTRSFRSIGPNVWERIAKVSGETRHGYWAVSSDGKILIITGFGKDSKGQEYYFHRVLERQ